MEREPVKQTRWSLAGALAASLAAGGAVGAPLSREEARVHAAGNGALLYRETHFVAPGGSGERWVLYRCPDGSPFARKRVAPAAAPATPNFAFEDGRDGYREGVRGTDRSRAVFVRGEDGAETARTVQVPADGVIDAGFDAAVRGHWQALMAGESVRMQFLVPSRKRFYPVRVQRVGATRWNGIEAQRLRMRLDAWFGFAVPDVQLVYASRDQRLLEFAGTGNVRDGRGANPQVRIRFAPAPAAATAADVQAAIRAPLDGRCPF